MIVLQKLSKTFYFMYKLFFLEIFNLLQFFLFVSALSRFNRINESEIIYDMNKLAWISECKFWNNSKTILYYIAKLQSWTKYLQQNREIQEIVQVKKSLISTFACFAKVQLREGRLATRLCLHTNLRFS